MSTVREQLQERVKQGEEYVSALRQIEEAMDELGLASRQTYLILGRNEWFDGHTYPGPYVKLYPRDVLPEGTEPNLADAAKCLLPKVGRWEKGFDGDQNQIRLVGTVNGVRVVLVDTTPGTCTVEVTEEVVEVPSYKDVRRKYVLKGDCDPLLEKVTV